MKHESISRVKFTDRHSEHRVGKAVAVQIVDGAPTGAPHAFESDAHGWAELPAGTWVFLSERGMPRMIMDLEAGGQHIMRWPQGDDGPVPQRPSIPRPIAAETKARQDMRTWLGMNAPALVIGGLASKHAATLGDSTSGIVPTPDGKGRVEYFQNGVAVINPWVHRTRDNRPHLHKVAAVGRL